MLSSWYVSCTHVTDYFHYLEVNSNFVFGYSAVDYSFTSLSVIVMSSISFIQEMVRNYLFRVIRFVTIPGQCPLAQVLDL